MDAGCEHKYWESVEFVFGGWLQCADCGWHPTEDEWDALIDRRVRGDE
jgi:hypothetical protein